MHAHPMRCLPARACRFTVQCALLMAVLVVSGGPRGACAEATPIIEAVEVGFGGVWRPGAWTPLTVRIAGSPEQPVAPATLVIETVTADADGGRAVRLSGPLIVENSGKTAVVRTVFQSGRLGSDLTVRLRDPQGPLLGSELRLRADALNASLAREQRLWLMAGRLAEATLPVPPGVVSAPLPSDALPVDPAGYDAAEVVFVRGDLAPTALQAEALRLWTAAGGHLVVILGQFTPEFTAGPLAGWVPLKVEGTERRPNLARLESFAGSNRRLPARARLRAAQIGGEPGQILAGDADAPLIARSAYGFGRVTAIVIDLDQPPLSNWPGLPELVRRAVQTAEPPAAATTHRTAAGAGVSDLATQLARAGDRFPEVRRPKHGTILLVLLVWAVVVGPLDYLLVHRVLRRPALTWLTLPLLVAATAWGLHAATGAAIGTTPQLNRLDVLDIDATTGTVRGRSTVTLYAPQAMQADLALTPTLAATPSSRPTPTSNGALPAGPRFSWTAPPEPGFGGLYRDAVGGLFRPEYTFPPPQDSTHVVGAPLLAGGSRRFEARWLVADSRCFVEANLSARGRGLLSGEVTHQLPGALSDYVIAVGDQVYLPADADAWQPGTSQRLANLQRRDLASFLTGSTTVENRRRDSAGSAGLMFTRSAYDPLSADVGTIVQMLTFHAAAGGRNYTGLTNNARIEDDLSELLQLDRAVLFGRLDVPAVMLTATAGDATFQPVSHATYVRLVLPISRQQTAMPELAPAKLEP